MPEAFATAGADYLEQLLRAAIQLPAAAADPASGQVVARLMVALVARGEDERLERYLSCSPGRRSVYEVTCYDGSDRPASWVTDLAAGRAISAAARFAAARPDRTVTIVARDDTGHERCVLVAKGPTAIYQFPEMGAVDDGGPGQAEGPTSTSRPDPSDAHWLALAERLESLPTTDEVVTALRDLLGRMTMDLRGRLGSLPTTEELISALRDLLGGMTIELDATAIEDVFHAALDDLPHFPTTADARAVTEASTADEPAPAYVAEFVGDGPAPPTMEIAARHPAGVPYGVSTNARRVADLVSDSSPEQEQAGAGSRGRVNPGAVSEHLTNRPPSDRAVEDDLALLALSSRRR
ncbi:MAG: hypothetical protein ABR540_21380 [Acidimicrobiales bacterium]|nr:hypothetical protein [Actinomycetota bacterium]